MILKYLGHSSFLIKSKYTVVTDPFHNIGYDMEKVSADFCLISHAHFDHNASENIQNSVVIDDARKVHLANDIALKAIKTYHDSFNGVIRGENTVYKFSMEGVTFCHLGDIGENYSPQTIERIGGCDVLFVPVGANYTIGAAEAQKYADHIAPALIVPMHYKTRRSNIDICGLNDFKSRYKSIIEAKNEFCFDKNDIKNFKKTVLLFDDKKY